jgi:hypothetical protein
MKAHSIDVEAKTRVARHSLSHELSICFPRCIHDMPDIQFKGTPSCQEQPLTLGSLSVFGDQLHLGELVPNRYACAWKYPTLKLCSIVRTHAYTSRESRDWSSFI